ncbi:MAG: type II toxin-antitoxin system RelE/ParE family toxin [Salinivirgaceae bacterium]
MFPNEETFIFEQKNKVTERFKVEILDQALGFIESLDEKTRDKVIYNIHKARVVQAPELFKKLSGEIWEFRTLYKKNYYRLFAFWDKSEKTDTVVISTHGIIKKTDKVPKSEIEKAERIRKEYFERKNN